MLITAIFIMLLTPMTFLIHLEGLWLIRRLPSFFQDLPRFGVLSVVIFCLFLHIVEISLYAGGFSIADRVFGVGQFNDERSIDALAYFYYAAITFTAVGYGDILPSGDIRILAIAESLNGLLLIGWSGAFTFIAMQKLWSDRAQAKREARQQSRKKASAARIETAARKGRSRSAGAS